MFTLIEKYPYLKNRFARARLAGKVEAHRLPFYNGRMKLGGEGYLLLGDAARLIDPFTGEGISHAMISGKIAAEVISGSMKKPAPGLDVAEKYESDIYKKLGRELELGLKLQQLATKPRLLNLVIGRAEKSEKVRQRLEEMLYSINSKGKLSKSWFYLKLMLGL